jgi:folate-binding protein YgfZ
MTSLPSKALELLASAAVHRTLDRVVHVRGDDARSWLNGQVSNDLRGVEEGEARYALALTVKGRIVSDLWVLAEGTGMALVLPAERCEATLDRFDKHIIMEDVELALDPALEVLTVQGPRAHDVLAQVAGGVHRYGCARLTPGGVDVWVEREQSDALFTALVMAASGLGGGALDAQSWSEAHVALAVPRVAVDFGEDSYPQEAGLGPRALSFQKGCYLGQEVVYMLENRGQLARRLVQLEGATSAPLELGALVMDEQGKRVGEVTSTTTSSHEPLALAYVKRPFAEPERTVYVAGSPYRVRSVVGVG